MKRIIKFGAMATLLLASGIYLLGQMSPGTPVINFRLPLFNEEGFRSWYLRGERGTYVSATQIRIEEMTVGQYSGNEEDRRIAVLTSPEAIFHFDSTTAYGPGELRIESDAFDVSGTDWIWRGEDKEIIFNQNVRVVLRGSIGDVLK